MKIGSFITYPLIILFVTVLVPIIFLWLIKCFKKYFPTDEFVIKELEELSRNKELVEKLERYAGVTTLIMIIVWLAMLYGMYVVAMTFIEPGSGKDTNLTISMLLVLVFMITAMGPAAYISSFITLIIFKLFNPTLKSRLLWNYHSGALRKGSIVNLLQYNKQHGINLARFNNFTAILFTVIFIIIGIIIYNGLEYR